MAMAGKNFQVGIKAFLQNGSRFLALKDAYSEYWDVPGGRIEASEIDQPVSECLRRELLEELGLNIRFVINNLFDVFKFRVAPTNVRHPNMNLFLVFYCCRFLEGEIVINEESKGYRWLTKENYTECSFGAYQKVVDGFVQQCLS